MLGSSGDVDWEIVLADEQEDVGRAVCDAISLYYEVCILLFLERVD